MIYLLSEKKKKKKNIVEIAEIGKALDVKVYIIAMGHCYLTI